MSRSGSGSFQAGLYSFFFVSVVLVCAGAVLKRLGALPDLQQHLLFIAQLTCESRFNYVKFSESAERRSCRRLRRTHILGAAKLAYEVRENVIVAALASCL